MASVILNFSNYGCSRWNFVAIVYTSWDIRYFLSTSGYWPPSLIYDLPKHTTVFPVVYPCCDIPKHTTVFPVFYPCCLSPETLFGRWILVAIMCISWDLCNYTVKAAVLDFWLPLTYLQLSIIAITPVDYLHMNIRGSQLEFRSKLV